MNNINFTSTYRIPITQAGVNPAKKDKLRQSVEPYPNKLVSKCNTGTVRVSIPDKDDAKFIKNLKTIGYKVFQKFEGENIPKAKLDNYIAQKLKLGEYQQFGTSKKRLSTSAKRKRYGARFEIENSQLSKEEKQEIKISKKLTKHKKAIAEAAKEVRVREQELAQATKKAEQAQKARLLAEIIEETKKSRSVVESAAKRRVILKEAAKRTLEAREDAEIAELDKAECTMLYNDAVEKLEDANLVAEVQEQVLREKMAKPKTEPESNFDPFDTNFDFEDYEI